MAGRPQQVLEFHHDGCFITGCVTGACGGGSGFFLECEEYERMFDNLFPDCAFFFFFLK